MNHKAEKLRAVLCSILEKHAPEFSPLLDVLIEELTEFCPPKEEKKVVVESENLNLFTPRDRTRQDDFSNYDLREMNIQYNKTKQKISFNIRTQRMSLSKEDLNKFLYFFYVWDDKKESFTELIKSNRRTFVIRILSRFGFMVFDPSTSKGKTKIPGFHYSNFKEFIADLKSRYEKEYGPTEIFDF